MRLALFTCLTAALCALPARAQTPEVVTAISAEEMAEVVREAGRSFGVPIAARAQQAPDTTFVVLGDVAFPGDSATAPDTLRFFVSLDACEGMACGALSAVAFFGSGEGGPGLAEMNAWNAARRLTRAYVTSQGLALQADLDLFGGLTREAIRRYVRAYLISLVTFADALQGAGEAVRVTPEGEE